MASALPVRTKPLPLLTKSLPLRTNPLPLLTKPLPLLHRPAPWLALARLLWEVKGDSAEAEATLQVLIVLAFMAHKYKH